jgi:SAM-dependent methyltransferase
LVYFLACIAFTLIANSINPAIWSPYYRITVDNRPLPYDQYHKSITVNYDGFQSIDYLAKEHIDRFPEDIQRKYVRHYSIPYNLSKKRIKSVLILGGGAGNDAAAAIRNNADFIDVVEIDPAIATIGYELHPEKPYASEKVHVYIDDARSFLQKTKQKYDLIMFGGLDSHTVFSSLSSLRLDNFVFTRESLIQAKHALNTGGGIAIDFFMTKDWLLYRHYNTLKEAMGREPLLYGTKKTAILLSGEIFDRDRSPGLTNYLPLRVTTDPSGVEIANDDWPFLFLEKRGVPFHYFMPLLIIFALSLIPIRVSRIKVNDINWHLFFMGAAFLLIETKAVTTLALILGSTWMVNSVVFSSILLMILLANLIAKKVSSLTFRSLYLGLF